MGCGPSKPATTSEEQTMRLSQGQTKPPLAPKQQSINQRPPNAPSLTGSQKDSMSTINSTTDTPVSTSREQSPTGKNPKRQSQRALEAKRRNDSGKQLQGEAIVLQGPPRDYAGLFVEKTDNDRFSHITRLASSIMKASCAAVILGAEDRIVLANAEGLDQDDDFWLPDFCAWALAQQSGLVTIEDLSKDDRTKGLKWVEEDPNLGFYAGASLHNKKGERLGVFCVMDFDPKPGATMLCQSLPNLGEMVHREIQAADQANSAENLLYRAMDTYWDGSVLVNTLEGPWRVRYANEAFSNMTGIDRHAVQGKDLRDFVELTGSITTEGLWKRLEEKTRQHIEYEIFPIAAIIPSSEYRSNSKNDFKSPHSRLSNPKRLKITMRPQSDQILRNYGMVPSDKEINGIFFAIFSPLATTTSRGTTSAIMDIVEKLVPFEGVSMGPIIGKGSFGSVFKAAYTNKIVAIKVIEFGDIAKVDAKGDPLEASLMLGLKHPNIVETLEHKTQHIQKEDTVEHQHSLQRHASMEGSGASSTGPRNMVMESWLMLEYCDIGTLSDGLEMGLFHEELQNGAVQTDRVPKMMVILQTARDIAAGLDHVHGHHILHGDLTAGNVLLASTPAGVQGARAFTAKVADFGLSRQAIASKVETNTYGTVTHMPPELLNEGIVSKAADVYAYGVLLCEVFTRRPVWEGLRHPQIIHAIAVQKKHPELPTSAPQPYRELANACMAAEPDDRPSFSAIIDSLDVMLSKKI